VRLSVRWQRHFGDNNVLELRPSEFGGVAVDAACKQLVIVTQSGDIASVATGNGDTIWNIHTDDKLNSKPVIHRQKVYIASNNGALTAYRLSDGEQLWRSETGMMLNGTPVVADGELFVAGSAEALLSFDLESGEQNWRHTHDRFTELDLRGGPSPLVTTDFIYVGYSDGTLYKLQRDGGNEVWSADLSGSAEELRDVDSKPLLIDGIVYANSFSGGIWALDAEDGNEIWHMETNGTDRLFPLPGEVLLTVGSNERVMWVDAAEGEILFEFEVDGRGLGGPLPLTEEYFAVFDSTQGLRIVDTERPFVHTEFLPGGGIDSTPVVSGQSMYVLTNHGYLYAIDMFRL
jgi:outer membrane protein assembly factor BamB